MTFEQSMKAMEGMSNLDLDILFAILQKRLLEISPNAMKEEHRGKPKNATKGYCKRVIKHLRIEQSSAPETKRDWYDQLIQHIRREWLGREGVPQCLKF